MRALSVFVVALTSLVLGRLGIAADSGDQIALIAGDPAGAAEVLRVLAKDYPASKFCRTRPMRVAHIGSEDWARVMFWDQDTCSHRSDWDSYDAFLKRSQGVPWTVMCKENRGDLPEGEYYYKTCGGLPKEAYHVLFGTDASVPSTSTIKSLTEAAARTVTVGPGFDCTGAHQPLAQMLCTDPELARTDLRFNQAYWALYRQVGEAGQRALKQEDVTFINAVQQRCIIPNSGALTPEVWEGRDCVRQSYENQRAAWLARLVGPAAEEAAREPERHITLQRALRQLGFLVPGDMLDGVYGAATRTAISTWQTSQGRVATGFLGDADAIALEQEVGGAPTALPVAEVQPPPPTQQPTSQPAPQPPVGEGLTVAVTPNRTDTALIIKGEIRNEAKTAREVPKLRVAVRDAGENELAMKVVNAPVDHLDAGATATFETMFEPNDQAAGVAVTFVAAAPASRPVDPSAALHPTKADTTTSDYSLDFDLKNQTNRPIIEVATSKTGALQWVPRAVSIDDGKEGKISFPELARSEADCHYDITVKFARDLTKSLMDVDLCKITGIVAHMQGTELELRIDSN